MIRKAAKKDAEGMHELHMRAVKVACKGFYTDEQIKGWLAKRSAEGYLEGIENDEMFVEEIEGKVLGFGHAVPGQILAVFVDPKFHGKGFGKSLLKVGLEMAKKENHRMIKVEASLNAAAFYQKCGFIETSKSMVDRNGQKLPVVLMEYSVA
ncbi:hypothetical protein A2974_02160 [Candidatus Peregrinibacteria bacterium RIFCSPLOWO2_01_FULL_48_20]|nr:MAG: hypothetical protein A2974_02160 [Candidatus Peregrinibacteria bacterium RIFCSPLOWO2_01_FULL_48_20]